MGKGVRKEGRELETICKSNIIFHKIMSHSSLLLLVAAVALAAPSMCAATDARSAVGRQSSDADDAFLPEPQASPDGLTPSDEGSTFEDMPAPRPRFDQFPGATGGQVDGAISYPGPGYGHDDAPPPPTQTILVPRRSRNGNVYVVYGSNRRGSTGGYQVRLRRPTFRYFKCPPINVSPTASMMQHPWFNRQHQMLVAAAVAYPGWAFPPANHCRPEYPGATTWIGSSPTFAQAPAQGDVSGDGDLQSRSAYPLPAARPNGMPMPSLPPTTDGQRGDPFEQESPDQATAGNYRSNADSASLYFK